MPKKKPAAAAKTPPAGELNPAALTMAQLEQVLAKAGGKTTAAQIAADQAAGAPANADGSLHLVHYTAWLASQVG